MKIVFADQGWDDFTYWIQHDRKIAKRIIRLLAEPESGPYQLKVRFRLKGHLHVGLDN